MVLDDVGVNRYVLAAATRSVFQSPLSFNLAGPALTTPSPGPNSKAAQTCSARTDPSLRLKPSPNLDGVIHDRLDSHLEHGTIESSNDQSDGESWCKFLKDKRNIQKTMRDMLHALIPRATFDRGVGNNLRVLGFGTSGLALHGLHMTQPNGHVFLLKSEQPRSVPQNGRQFPEFRIVLIDIL
jgi:hypothetical protein